MYCSCDEGEPEEEAEGTRYVYLPDKQTFVRVAPDPPEKETEKQKYRQQSEQLRLHRDPHKPVETQELYKRKGANGGGIQAERPINVIKTPHPGAKYRDIVLYRSAIPANQRKPMRDPREH